MKWNREEGLPKKDDKMTIYGEKAGQPINLAFFWDIVTVVIDREQGTYEITNDN